MPRIEPDQIEQAQQFVVTPLDVADGVDSHV
jgi:hypothetical protein